MTAAEVALDSALAERLVAETWSARVGLGDVNCVVELPRPDAGKGLALVANGDAITLRGAEAEACAKSLAGAQALSEASCPSPSECAGKLRAKSASAYCEPSDDPCRILFACGKTSMRDVVVEAGGDSATIRFRVVGEASVPTITGCGPAKRATQDTQWAAKAKRSGGRWSIDGTPEAR